MKILLTAMIFCVVFFLYLHIYHHLKLSNDLEIYTIDGKSKDKLEEVCDLRQPALFKYQNNIDLKLQDLIKHYSSFDIVVKNNKKTDDISLPVSIGNALTLFKKDADSKYFSDHNEDFIEETGLKKMMTQNDMFLRPTLVSSCQYDLQLGSINCWTPLQYSMNYRNYVFVSDGEITIKLIPPIYSKYLYEEKYYDTFEFRSPINPWNVQEQYSRYFGKVRFLELTLKVGDILYIPAYWWYSIKYTKISVILWFKYRTIMNSIAILPQTCISILQKQNTKFDIIEKL